MTESGITHGGSSIRVELPPARTEPLDAERTLWPILPRRERFLAQQVIGGEPVFAAVRTGTKVDVGSWLLRGRVWIFALADSLVYVACGGCGLRAHARQIPYNRLRESQYNHVTGQLALAPVEGLPFRGLQVDPIEGYQVLAQIYRED